MRGFSAIFRKELKSGLRTPQWWAVAGLFACLAGFYFVVDLTTRTAVLALEIRFLNSILFVFVPLLTMKTYAGERQSGTDHLLLTAPVRARDIVLGKFLSACLLFVLLSSVLAVHLIFILVLGGRVDSIALAAFLGYALTGFLYIAIGQFISAMAQSQTIAALASMVVFLLFNLLKTMSGSIGVFIGRFIGWLDIFDWLPAGGAAQINVAVTQAIDWLNPATKLEPIVEGIFSFTDLIYILSLLFLILFISVLRIESRRYAKSEAAR